MIFEQQFSHALVLWLALEQGKVETAEAEPDLKDL